MVSTPRPHRKSLPPPPPSTRPSLFIHYDDDDNDDFFLFLPYLLPFRPTSNNTEQSRESPSAVFSSLYFAARFLVSAIPIYVGRLDGVGWTHPLEIGLERDKVSSFS